jgi:hypothetical protein
MRALWLFLIYMVVVLTAAVVLVKTIGENALAAQARVERPSSKDSLDCNALVRVLDAELWQWYVDDLRASGPEPHSRGPYPGALEEWEAARLNGVMRCGTDERQKKLAALESVRQRLEATSYLLARTAGKDIALLRE